MGRRIARARCTHPKVPPVTYDAAAARGLSATEVRERFPRGHCTDCNTILYATFEHIIAGGW